jgi:hypothetical protein
MKKHLALVVLCAASLTCAPALACGADLSVESLELRKAATSGPLSIRVVVANIGTEGFYASQRFMPVVTIETINGATGLATQHTIGNIALMLPGNQNRSATTLRRTAFGTGQNVGTVRGYITLNPAAPECGTDADSTNNEFRLTNEQIRAWLRGSAPSVVIERPIVSGPVIVPPTVIAPPAVTSTTPRP